MTSLKNSMALGQKTSGLVKFSLQLSKQRENIVVVVVAGSEGGREKRFIWSSLLGQGKEGKTRRICGLFTLD